MKPKTGKRNAAAAQNEFGSLAVITNARCRFSSHAERPSRSELVRRTQSTSLVTLCIISNFLGLINHPLESRVSDNFVAVVKARNKNVSD
jgi:hypothetical protein